LHRSLQPALQILLKSIHDSLMFGSWFNERA
jgi:hypothetical protein